LKEARPIRRTRWLATLALAAAVPAAAAGPGAPPDNPAIDVTAHLCVAAEAARHREARRIDEDTFIRLSPTGRPGRECRSAQRGGRPASREPGTAVLAARRRERHDALHVRGAVNLPFPGITAGRLAQLVPDRGTRILVCCNNDFTGARAPFPTKLPSASLNLSTFAALYDYGYRNVYELRPLLDARTTRIALAGTLAAAVRAR